MVSFGLFVRLNVDYSSLADFESVS